MMTRDPETIAERVSEMQDEIVAEAAWAEACEIYANPEDINEITEAFEEFIGQLDRNTWLDNTCHSDEQLGVFIANRLRAILADKYISSGKYRD